MKRMLLRITAPHFVAGAVYQRRGDLYAWQCVRAAPIIAYLQKMDAATTRDYLTRKRWTFEWLPL